ncbi:hypothetical protein UlMin_000259 [Ulmus minor]
MEFVSHEGLRLDGCRPMKMKQIRAEHGSVAKANGFNFALFEMRNTKVTAAVYGPREIIIIVVVLAVQVHNRSQQLSDQALVCCEYNMANFSTGNRMWKPKGNRQSTKISLVIRQTMKACILTHLISRASCASQLRSCTPIAEPNILVRLSYYAPGQSLTSDGISYFARRRLLFFRTASLIFYEDGLNNKNFIYKAYIGQQDIKSTLEGEDP